MNYIGIDPSLTCTAMTVNGVLFVYTTTNLALTEKQNLSKWFELCDQYVTFRLHDLDKSVKFSDSEIGKLEVFSTIIDNLITDVLSIIDVSCETIIGIEGYSYNAAAGPLIDLVTFGTLLRYKLLENIKTCRIVILPPSTLKLKSAQLTYLAIELGKKVKKYEWRNNEGVSGGAFKKPEMFKCLTENTNFNSDWVKFLREHSDDILNRKSIPKPIEDINDSLLIYEIIKLNK